MKKLILTTIAAVTLSFNVSATDESKDQCKFIHKLATSIMGNRQLNADMPEMMKLASGNKMIEEVVINAYDRPAYSVKKNQDDAVKRFANEYYLECKRILK